MRLDWILLAHATESNKEAANDREGVTISEGVINMHKAGRLGKKNKQGFYKYDDKGKRKGIDSSAYQFFQGNGSGSLPNEEIQNRPLMLMLNEAVMCLEEGILSSVKDGDLGAVFGIGFLTLYRWPIQRYESMGCEERGRYNEAA